MKDDPYSFVVALFSFLLGQHLGTLIGPYILILICSAAGAQIALGRRDPGKKPAGMAFIGVVVCAAFCGTWIISNLLANYVDGIGDARTLFAPVAFAIGFVGLDWDEVLPWALDKYLQFRGLPPRESKNG